MSGDIKYLEVVSASIQKLAKEDKVVDWDKFVKEEGDLIISSYNGDNLNSFKGD
ncbi:uncharacterized protein EV154DRAFT_565330 [Mucor mucedo]|uniref:uncharacterized protein n=1 Tax=Mucor mucedo TaxID=29922 RepID=UPI0022204CD3|nr:uncharacterized protein EV154DRAFT_565330 [Mucor mucedo]KAI7889504.1 hypothetical protein EV154DRAFT_565330 [Mucor mucedo]